MTRITVISLLAAFLVLCINQPASAQQDAPLAALPDWQFAGMVEPEQIPEPSGMCFCPPLNILFVVDDGAIGRPSALYAMDLKGNVLDSTAMGVDLEGVCYCGYDGMLYVADESAERIFVVNPSTMDVAGSFTISTEYEGEPLLTRGGNGIEGIEYIDGEDGGYFLLLNQDDPHVLLKVTYGEARSAFKSEGVAAIADYRMLTEINLGSLHYDKANAELWVVHSWMNVMEILDVPSLEVKRWEVIPGSAQEAVAMDAEGRLWIGYDSGGIAWYVRPDKAS